MSQNWEELGFDWKGLGFDREPDRYEASVRQGYELYGYDESDGLTTWYTKDGEIDYIMPTEFADTADEES